MVHHKFVEPNKEKSTNAHRLTMLEPLSRTSSNSMENRRAKQTRKPHNKQRSLMSQLKIRLAHSWRQQQQQLGGEGKMSVEEMEVVYKGEIRGGGMPGYAQPARHWTRKGPQIDCLSSTIFLSFRNACTDGCTSVIVCNDLGHLKKKGEKRGMKGPTFASTMPCTTHSMAGKEGDEQTKERFWPSLPSFPARQTPLFTRSLPAGQQSPTPFTRPLGSANAFSDAISALS